MKVILAGHSGSHSILSASSWLVNKYLPDDFDVYWLNYGLFTNRLFTGTYVPLDEKQVGGVKSWASYLASYISEIEEPFVVFGLDDYLLSGSLNMEMFNELLAVMKNDMQVVCGRLCDSSFYKNARQVGKILIIQNEAYTCTTQYCIWNRVALIHILDRTTTPWDFEIRGSEILNNNGWCVAGSSPKALEYPDYSCLSSKWKGVKYTDNNQEDIKFLKEHAYII